MRYGTSLSVLRCVACGTLILMISCCCSVGSGTPDRTERHDVGPVGAVQLFWDSCQAFDRRGVADSLAPDPAWNAEKAIRFVTGGRAEPHISDAPAPLFVAKELIMHSAEHATVVGDVLEKLGDRELVDWAPLYTSFKLSAIKVEGKWLVSLSDREPR